nr:NAD(P)/FAD-dependent oxidoreductase [Govania unica]
MKSGLALGAFGLSATAFPRALSAKTATPDVLVIGAGLSGLYAALLLEEEGLKVQVIEASNRIGGRLKTLDHLPGAPEVGGQTVDSMYARVLDMMTKVGVDTVPRGSDGEFSYYIRDQSFAKKDWATSPANILSGAERAITPDRMLSWAMDRENILENIADWQDQDLLKYDDLSIHAFLQQKGYSEEALRFMDRWFDGVGMNNMSALFACRKDKVQKAGRDAWYRIKGGSARLPEAMAKALAHEVHFNKVVKSITTDKKGVEARCADGSVYRAQHAIVSIPFSVLRDVAIYPALPKPQAAFVQTMPYNQTTLIKIGFNAPYWEQDGLAPGLYSDTFIERIAATKGQDGQLHMLDCWIKGSGALAMDVYSTAEIGQRVLAELARIRPASAGKTEVLDVMSWGKNPYSRGSYHFLGVGQFRKYGADWIKPHGRMHFIGEHTAQLSMGMEGACESAEREALAIIESRGA